MTSKSKRYCSVPQCHNYVSETITMHRFPPDIDLQNKWKKILKIGKPITKFMSVCSEHFLPEDYCKGSVHSRKKILKRGMKPSQKIPIGSHQNNVSERKRSSRRKCLLEANEEDAEPLLFHQMPSSSLQSAPIKFPVSFGVNVEPLKTNVLYEDKSTQTDDFQLNSILDTDKKLMCFTGIDFGRLDSITKCVINVMNSNHTRKDDLLSTKIIITLMKLKLNISFACIAMLFSLSVTTCRRYFTSTIELLATSLKPTIYWPTKEEILLNLPNCFEKFKNVGVVLDCTEVCVQKSKCLNCRIKTYSHYKGCHTLKWLIGITPSGLISFISCGYGGRASDKSIFLKENLLSKCNPLDDIMVDKIEQECEEALVKLIRPPFLKKKQQLSKSDAEQTAEIARARVHVERAIQRIKTFNILNDKIDSYMIPLMDHIMVTVSALVNLSPPIL